MIALVCVCVCVCVCVAVSKHVDRVKCDYFTPFIGAVVESSCHQVMGPSCFSGMYLMNMVAFLGPIGTRQSVRLVVMRMAGMAKRYACHQRGCDILPFPFKPLQGDIGC